MCEKHSRLAHSASIPDSFPLLSSSGGVQLTACHKIINLLKTFFFAHQFWLVFVYLMCGPRRQFFFQCGPEMPQGWTPLL